MSHHLAIKLVADYALMRVGAIATIPRMQKGNLIGLAKLSLVLSAALTGCTVAPTQQTLPPAKPVVSSPTNSTIPISTTNNAEETGGVQVERAPHDDMWAQLAQDFTWTNYPNPSVKAAIDDIIEKREDFTRMAAHAAPYLRYIADQLAQHELPAELALIPLIESGYRPRAQSPQGAVGLWQFMPETGRQFGLKRSLWYDGRSDVIASTQAALDYLERLNNRFNGDWLLTLAAYNCGPAKVRRAIGKSNLGNYWEVAADLPTETRKHISRLLATIQIVGDPMLHGVALQPIPNVPVVTEFDLGGPIALEYITDIEDWSVDKFEELNPAFKRQYTDPDGPFGILVPVALELRIRETLSRIRPDQRVPVQIHLVQRGDTLSQIADRYNVSVEDLKRHNKLRGTLINIDTELVVPSPLQALHGQKRHRSNVVRVGYTVRAGDSLWTIGRKFGSSYKAIAKLNNLPLNTPLRPGQNLVVQESDHAQRYDIRRGDSLWKIARKFNVTIDQLQEWNDLSRRQLLQPGETLFVSNPHSLARQEI